MDAKLAEALARKGVDHGDPSPGREILTALLAELDAARARVAEPLGAIDRDAAVEAGVVAARVERLPEHDDTIAEAVALGISVALDHLSALPYPVRLGPAPKADR